MTGKEKILCIAALAAVALTGGIAAACAEGGEQVSGVREEYTGSMYAESALPWREQALRSGGYTYTGEGITLDGRLDEAEWQSTYPLTYTSIGIQVSVYVTFGQDGFYVGYDIRDTEAYFVDERSSENNSSIEIYFSPVTTSLLDETVLQVRMEPNNDITCYRALGSVDAQLSYPWSAGYLPIYGVSDALNGWTVDENGAWTTDGALQYEMFIGWDALSLEEAPEKFKLYPCYNYVNSTAADAYRVSQVWPQGRYNQPMDYFEFDEKGYVNNDACLAEENGAPLLLGDAGNGLAKSAAWDLTQLNESGAVKSTENARGSKYIYVAGADDGSYMFSASAYYVTNVSGDTGARMGIVMGRLNSGKTDLNMYTETLQVAVIGNDAGKYQLTTKVGDDEGGKYVSWVSTALAPFAGNSGASSAEPVKFTVVKQGEMFLYFLNDNYIGTKVNAAFADGCAVGLYTLAAQAVYSDILYETDADEIAAYLSGRDIHTVTIAAGAGGTFGGTVGSDAVDADHNMTAFVGSADILLNVMPTMDAARTFVVSSVTVNGEQAQLSEGGVLRLEDCSEATEIAIEFTAIAQGAAITFTGGAADVTIVQKDGVNSYALKVEEGLTVRLADGTWEIAAGDKTVTVVVENGSVTSGSTAIDVGQA